MAQSPEAIPPWILAIQQSIDARDARESTPFKHIIGNYQKLSKRAQKLTIRIRELEGELKKAEQEREDAQRSLSIARQIGSDESLQKAALTSTELAKLKEERNDLYRLQANNAQRVVELTDLVNKLQAELESKKNECEKLQGSYLALQVKLQDKDNLLAEKDKVIQILKDEHSALSLELSQKEEKCKNLEKENAEVLERYLALKLEMVEKMNEANEMVEDALRIKESAKGPGRLSPSSSKGDVGIETTRRKGSFSVLPTQPLRKLTAHKSDTNCLSISPDSRLLATGSDDRSVIIWDAATGAQKSVLQGSGAGVMAVGFSYANDMVIAGANDNAAKVWTLSTGRLKHTLTGHQGKVLATKFTVDNKVITASQDRTLKVWDLARGYCTKNVFTLSSCNDICLLDDGGHLVASGHLDNSIRIWDMNSGKAVRELTGLHSEQVVSVTVSEDKSQLLSLSRDNTLRLIDTRTFQPISTYSSDSFRVAVNHSKACFSADARFIVAGGVDGGVYIWNAEKTTLETVLRAQHAGPVCGVVWSPLGGARLYSMDTKKGIVIWGGSGEHVG